MQIIINAPDNLPQAIIQQHIKELEMRLMEQAKRLSNKSNQAAKEQAIIEIAKRCASLPDLDLRSSDEILGYSESLMGLWGDE